MDIVYPYRRAGDGDELRYSLRSLKNLPHDRVWVVGEKPGWLNNANFIPIAQTRNKWQNARRNLIAACENPDLSDEFYWFNDDFFMMEPMEEVPFYYRGTIEEVVQRYRARSSRGHYISGFIETAEILRWAGYKGELYAYNLHVPLRVNKHKFLESIDLIRRVKPVGVPQCFHLRSWYGNYAECGGEQMKDVKVRNPDSLMPENRRFLSTSNKSFKAGLPAYKTITQAFPEPSKYESGGPDGLNRYPSPRIRSGSRLSF